MFLSLLLIIVPLLAVFYIPKIPGKPFAERYLYLPSFGFVFLLTLLLAQVRVKFAKGDTIVAVVIIVITGLYSTGTVSRNMIWKDNRTLYTDAVRKSPDVGILHVSLGNALEAEGRIDDAIEQYLIALTLDLDELNANSTVHTNLGAAYGKKRWWDKAIEELKIAITIEPGNNIARKNLGSVYALSGQIDKSIEQLQAAVEINPIDAEAHRNLGMAYSNNGQLDKAREQFHMALRLNPDAGDVRNYLEMIMKQEK